MNPFLLRRRFGTAAVAGIGLLWAHAALATCTVISTTNFAANGSGQAQSYRVPAGANCVIIQAWGTVGYVCASYCASPGSTFSVQLTSAGGGETEVQTSGGTVTVAGSPATCSAGGSAFNVTTDANVANGSGPASPGAGKSYPGYVTIQAASATYTLTITDSPSSAGTASGAGTYAVGTLASIKESPWNGYSASGWGGPDGLSVTSPSSASSSITMTADRTLVANFSPLMPVFTSSGAAQTLVVGTPVSFQVAASQSPVFSASELPPGLAISSSGLISGTPTAPGIYSTVVTANNDAVSVEEAGVGANEIVDISSSTLGEDLSVYACAIDIGVNGDSTTGFCIDPWHSSAEDQWLDYDFESLSSGPKVADGMGMATALQIEQLWEEYYSAGMSNATAAGLQIAIWDLVSASISAQTDGASWFTLNSSNNYGASSMLAWVESNPDAAAANLYAVTGNGQDYVVSAASLPQPIVAAASATQMIPFVVYAQPTVASGSASVPVDQAYSYAITATGSPTSYTASGLPPGLALNAATGLISGAPTATGTYAVNLTAANPGAAGTGTLTLTVTAAYTLTIANAAGGTAAGAGTYPAGTTVTIAEAASSGYRTAGWGGPNAGSLASAANASTTLVMNGNYALTPQFIQQGTLMIAGATGGTAAGGGTFDVGSVQPIAATPSAAWTFSGWSGAGIASDSAASTTVTITGNETITPQFMAPPSATITAPATAYSLSPLTVQSSATAPADNLTLHSIEWLSPDGTWTVSTTPASGGGDNRTFGITFPTTGVWTVRAGASTDGGLTWYYSASQQITVTSGLVTYAFETMSVPPASLTNWYNPSPVAQRTYQVQQVNP